jgi:hypothetical protein
MWESMAASIGVESKRWQSVALEVAEIRFQLRNSPNPSRRSGAGMRAREMKNHSANEGKSAGSQKL